MTRIILIILIIVPRVGSADVLYTCRALFVRKVPLYLYVNPGIELLNQPFSADGTVSTVLGHGVGGEARLIRTNQHRDVYVTKQYFFKSDALLRISSDYWLLGEFERLLKNRPRTFRFPRTVVFQSPGRTANEPVLTMNSNFIPGRSVHSLLTDTTTSPEVKAKVSQIYSEKLDELERQLTEGRYIRGMLTKVIASAQYFRDGTVDGTFRLAGRFRNGFYGADFIIKSDNVIVDPYDLSIMTIIDPY